MAKKHAAPRAAKSLAEREAYHKRALENIVTRKQIEDLRKKLKTGK